MTETLTHFIGGKQISAPGALESLNPSNTGEVIAKFPDGSPEDVNKAVEAARAAFPGLVGRHAGSARRRAGQSRSADHRAQGCAGPAARQRRGQDPTRSHRRDSARRAHLQIFRRRGAAPPWPESGIRASRRGNPDLSRSRRRLWPDHAVEFSHRHSRLENRAGPGLRQYGGLEARQSHACDRACAGRDHP